MVGWGHSKDEFESLCVCGWVSPVGRSVGLLCKTSISRMSSLGSGLENIYDNETSSFRSQPPVEPCLLACAVSCILGVCAAAGA